jgi:hypothetical protein
LTPNPKIIVITAIAYCLSIMCVNHDN